MKLFPLSLLSCLALIFVVDGQIIKISGKWYNKTSVLSQNGRVTKTIYTPLTQAEILSLNGNGVSETTTKTTQNGNIFTVVNNVVESPASLAKARRKIKNIKSSHNMDMKEAKNDRVHQLDLEDIQSEGEDKNSQKVKIDVSSTEDKKIPEVIPKDPHLTEEGKKLTPLNVVSNDRLENDNDQSQVKYHKSAVQIISPSFAKPFSDVESPFIRRESDKEEGNISTNQTNIIEGKGNLVDGKYNQVTGNKNLIDNGNYNQIRGDKNIVKDGDNNIINGFGSLVIGSGNKIH